MYTKEQQGRALKEFERLGSVQAAINLLGYPSKNTLYEWNKAMRANKQNNHGSPDKPYIIKEKYINSPSPPRYPDVNLKLNAIRRCFSLGEGVEYVSKDIGYSRMSISKWYRNFQKYGVVGLMASKKQIKRCKSNIEEQHTDKNISELQEQINSLQEVDILKETVN